LFLYLTLTLCGDNYKRYIFIEHILFHKGLLELEIRSSMLAVLNIRYIIVVNCLKSVKIK